MTKFAIPLTDNTLSQHFGHCEKFTIYTSDDSGKKIVNEEQVVPPPHEPGVYPQWLKSLGVELIITGGMGRRALDLFAQNGIRVCAGQPGATPEAVVESFLSDSVGNEEPSCGHNHDHDCQ